MVLETSLEWRLVDQRQPVELKCSPHFKFDDPIFFRRKTHTVSSYFFLFNSFSKITSKSFNRVMVPMREAVGNEPIIWYGFNLLSKIVATFLQIAFWKIFQLKTPENKYRGNFQQAVHYGETQVQPVSFSCNSYSV